MNSFSLSRKPESVCPAEIRSADGRAYPVHADFRTVLRCLRMLDDPDEKESRKMLFVCRWFYPEGTPPDGMQQFLAFVRDGDAAESGEPPVMDFEVDAPEIYASFLQRYGIDLLRDTLHWRAFRALLCGLGPDTALGRKIQTRTLDTSGMRGKARSEAEKRKRAVALPARVSALDRAWSERIALALERGEDVAELMREHGHPFLGRTERG